MYESITKPDKVANNQIWAVENWAFLVTVIGFVLFGTYSNVALSYWVGIGLTWYFVWRLINTNRYLHPYYLVLIIFSSGILQKIDPAVLPPDLNQPYLGIIVLGLSLFRLNPESLKFAYVFERYLNCASSQSLKQYSFLFGELGLVFGSLYLVTINQLNLGSYITICLLYAAYVANTCYCKSKLKANKRVLARLIIVPIVLIGLMVYRVDFGVMMIVVAYGLGILNSLFILNSYAPLLRKLGFDKLRLLITLSSLITATIAIYLNLFSTYSFLTAFILQLCVVAIYQLLSGSYEVKRLSWVVKLCWLITFSTCVLR
jgi:hypothetical protein